jgi:bacteriocin biosynthesis cyclodehydratase domain-containing protein
MGSMMALEAVRLIAGAGTPLVGAMLIYDGLHAETRRLAIAPRPGCQACGGAGGSPAGPAPAARR